jgi:hypothetical protein
MALPVGICKQRIRSLELSDIHLKITVSQTTRPIALEMTV